VLWDKPAINLDGVQSALEEGAAPKIRQIKKERLHPLVAHSPCKRLFTGAILPIDKLQNKAH
jgi:hypothetical protein